MLPRVLSLAYHPDARYRLPRHRTYDAASCTHMYEFQLPMLIELSVQVGLIIVMVSMLVARVLSVTPSCPLCSRDELAHGIYMSQEWCMP